MKFFEANLRQLKDTDVLKNSKNDLWNKAWQLTSSPLNLQTINRKSFRISLLNINSEGAVSLQLVLFIQSSISLQALRVCVL